MLRKTVRKNNTMVYKSDLKRETQNLRVKMKMCVVQVQKMDCMVKSEDNAYDTEVDAPATEVEVNAPATEVKVNAPATEVKAKDCTLKKI